MLFHSILRLLSRGLRVLRDCLLVKFKNQTVPDVFRQVVAKHPHKVMLINSSTGAQWVYQDVRFKFSAFIFMKYFM